MRRFWKRGCACLVPAANCLPDFRFAALLTHRHPPSEGGARCGLCSRICGDLNSPISGTGGDQPTAVQVPSGLRQALPRATSGRPSI